MLESLKKRRMFFIFAFIKTLPVAALPIVTWLWRDGTLNLLISVAAGLLWLITLAYEWRRAWREAKAKDLRID